MMDLTDRDYLRTDECFNSQFDFREDCLYFKFSNPKGYSYGYATKNGMCIVVQEETEACIWMFDCPLNVEPMKRMRFVRMYNYIMDNHSKVLKQPIDLSGKFELKNKAVYTYGPFKTEYNGTYSTKYHINNLNDEWVDIPTYQSIKDKMEELSLKYTKLSLNDALNDPFSEVKEKIWN